jgi:hypothetical protein
VLDTILGLPAHPLIVHAVVVLVPLAALLVGASAVSARFRHWSRYATPLVSLAGLAMVPLATQSGEGLERSVAHSALVEQHAELADSLLPLMLALTAVAVAQWWLDRRSLAETGTTAGSADGATAGTTAGARPRDTSSRQRTLGLVVAVVALLVSAGTLVQVGRIGHSGAKAVWSDVKVSGAGNDESGAARP